MTRRVVHKVQFPYGGPKGGFILACGQDPIWMNGSGRIIHASNSARWKHVTCRRCLKRRPKKGTRGNNRVKPPRDGGDE